MPQEIAAGTNQINNSLAEAQEMILQGSGMGDWLTLTK